MSSKDRIKVDKYTFAKLISEVNSLCPLCSEELITLDGSKQGNLSQAAHIYPHSPSDSEKKLLKDVPRLSEDPEDINNLIMLCPSCHWKFDHPRTVEEYMQLYNLKKVLIQRQNGRMYYKKHSLEDDLLTVLHCIGSVDLESDQRKLSYNVIKVKNKMSKDASNSIKQIVMRDVHDYYIPIKDALVQLEQDAPGKSDLIAKEIALFYTELNIQGFSQDEIYYSINDWINEKTKNQHTFLAPFITAFYIQNCEVFSS